MAVRLSVIMVHSAPPLAASQKMAESVVGELIGLVGIDLILIGPIDQLTPDSTDHLTVGSITSDVAILDWQAPSQTLQTLHQMGFAGQRAPHRHDPEAPTPKSPVRRFYLFDLMRFSTPALIIEALSKLKSSREVRTFEIGGGNIAPSQTAPVASKTLKPSPEPTIPDRATPKSPPAPLPGDQTLPSGGKLDLDDLLDQLDRSDP